MAIKAIKLGKYMAQFGGGSVKVQLDGRINGVLEGSQASGTGSIVYTKDVASGNTLAAPHGINSDPVILSNPSSSSGSNPGATFFSNICYGNLSVSLDNSASMQLTSTAGFDKQKKELLILSGAEGTLYPFHLLTVAAELGETMSKADFCRGCEVIRAAAQEVDNSGLVIAPSGDFTGYPVQAFDAWNALFPNKAVGEGFGCYGNDTNASKWACDCADIDTNNGCSPI